MNVIILIILFIFLFLLLNNQKFENVYKIKGYTDLKNDLSTSLTPGGIPKIIIKTSWQTRDSMPIQMINVLEKTKSTSPDYQLYYFDNLECEEFMKDYSPRVFEAYNKVIPGAFKADLFRICILEKYGGCYSDIGHVPFVSFNTITGDQNMVLVKDCPIKWLNGNCKYYGIHNALMCSVKNHEFFKLLIEKTCENIEFEYYGESSLDVTGPTMIGKQFNCYFLKDCPGENIDLIKPGDFVYRDTKIRILNYAIKSGAPASENRVIVLGNKAIINTKFEDYYNIMYHSVKQLGYVDLWKSKKIFN